jgi:biopolymer transport protein TolQ
MMDICLSPLPLASLWKAFDESSLMGQAIVVLQFIGSIFVWALMIGKGRELRTIDADCRDFLRGFTSGPDTLDLYVSQNRRAESSPFDVIYRKTCDRLVKLFDRDTRQALIGRRGGEVASAALTARELTLVSGTSEHMLAEQVVRVERGMSSLATATTAAPLVGLLGTVWGVLDAFQIVGEKGSAQLAEMAPAISSALLTTVVGLLVAIPSGIDYNILQKRVRSLVIDLEGFTDELTGRISCEFQGKGE